MAKITYHVPVSTYDMNNWSWGVTTVANNSHMQFSTGRYTQDQVGSFTYSGNKLVGGTIDSISFSEWNSVYLTISNINADLSTWESALTNGQGAQMGLDVYKGDDTYIGSSGNDDMYTYTGNDTYDGGAGIDTVHYANVSRDGSGFTATKTAAGYNVKGAGKTDTLINIERLDFGDGSTLALDVGAGEHTGQAFRLYQAAFDRQADTGGLKYWVERLDSDLSLTQAAQLFVETPEFKKVNTDQSSTGLITSYYQHVLNRAPDAGGLAYWENAMATGNTNAAHMLVSFSESAENIANTSAALDGGIWLV